MDCLGEASCFGLRTASDVGKEVSPLTTVGAVMVSVKPGVRFDCRSLIPSHAAMKEANHLESLGL